MRVVPDKKHIADRAPAGGEEHQGFDHYLILTFWHMEVNVWPRFGNFVLTQRRGAKLHKTLFKDGPLAISLNRLRPKCQVHSGCFGDHIKRTAFR